MSSLDQLKITFFDECGELLEQAEAGLTEIREGTGTDESVNAVFRAVHSVKGGAGIFGFEALVGFAHVFETTLDLVRRGSLAITPEVVDVMLTASDVLADLVAMSRAGDAIAPDYGAESRSALEQLVSATGEGEDGAAAPAEFEGLEFTPLRADEDPSTPEDFDGIDFSPVAAAETGVPEADDGVRGFAITFRPSADLLKKANEPLYLMRELRKLGELELTAETDRIPPLTELEPDYPYLGWTGTLTSTTATLEQVQEVFEFVIGDCELEITEAGKSGGAQDGAPTAVAPAPDAVLEPSPSAAPQDNAVEQPAAVANAVAAVAAEPSAPEIATAPAAAAAPTRNAPPAKAAATTTRVELEKIDRVVNMVGELVIAQAMLAQTVQMLPLDHEARLAQTLEEVIHHTRELKDSVMSMRAQPIGAVFQRMPRLVREVSAKISKKVRLEMAGENTEIDRSIIERLGDPLTHIIRNSVDHGIEPAADRLAAGKKEEGTIWLSAEHRGGRIVIQVKDDGGGINSDRVLKKAREKGLVGADATLTEDEINNLVFMPGFSTAEVVSDISGRGVGMDVVRRNIQDIGGRISLKSERGRGTTIQLALPLTLAVMDGMVIKVGGETYVLPMSAIVECLRPGRSEIHNLVGSHGMLKLRGDLVPVVPLAELLAVSSLGDAAGDRVVIITEAGEGVRFGLVVDELLGHQQVVIKSIEESYGSVPGIAGATILGNGRVAFILDADKLSDLAGNQNAQLAHAPMMNFEPPATALAS
jgi:two-component system, chemotaxis family, sensor kinase CheA